jgi:phosphonate transport system substrate-binding protein
MMFHRKLFLFLAASTVLGGAQGCSKTAARTTRPLTLSAIPDQDPERLQRLYQSVATYLSKELEVDVVYKPVTDYKAAVMAFNTGDLDLVWFGGLTGVQARLRTPGAKALAQRDVDAEFHSVFIANKAKGITDLQSLKGHTFTFGSESSTSGRLMPQHFLETAGVHLEDFRGAPGFSGSHDKTIELVTAGTFDAGALNEQVWKSRLAKGTIDTSKVAVFWTSPAYHDYHWVAHPGVDRFGSRFLPKIEAALLKLDASNPDQAPILELFSAHKFVATNEANYKEIEAVGRRTGLIVTN